MAAILKWLLQKCAQCDFYLLVYGDCAINILFIYLLIYKRGIELKLCSGICFCSGAQ